ncbi:transmembrane 220 family protein [Aurantibacter sp.]|uniref:transmembrane 220 family protein n=1 Tax=Aurantibacter sp. TaxID=2807103 RepID=UPI003262F309
MKSFAKIFAWIYGILSITSAVLQYNDPDPLLWIVIYAIAALVSFGVALNRVSYLLPLIFGVLGVLGAIYVYPETFEGFEIGKGDIKNIEEGREAFGLIIMSVAMFFFAWYRKRNL